MLISYNPVSPSFHCPSGTSFIAPVTLTEPTHFYVSSSISLIPSILSKLTLDPTVLSLSPSPNCPSSSFPSSHCPDSIPQFVVSLYHPFRSGCCCIIPQIPPCSWYSPGSFYTSFTCVLSHQNTLCSALPRHPPPPHSDVLPASGIFFASFFLKTENRCQKCR